MARFVKVSNYAINEQGDKGRYVSKEILYQVPSFDLILNLLNEGPCDVVFNRVYSKKMGVRGLRCVKPTKLPMNAFDPRYPTLIAVIDLQQKFPTWRSFRYEEIFILERLRKKDLSYQERKVVTIARGHDWDYLFPGSEGDALRAGDDRPETQGYSLKERGLP